MREIAKLFWVVRRDLVSELRTFEVLTATLIFPPLVLLIFRFSFAVGERLDAALIAPGILWTTLVFAGSLATGRSFAVEKEDDRWLSLVMAPVDRGTLFLGKFVANLLYLAVVSVLTLLTFELFFSLGLFRDLRSLSVVVALGVVGISAVGTLMASMAVNTRARETLMPLLMIPVLVPVLIGCVEATQSVLAGAGLEPVAKWVRLMGAVDIVYSSLGFLLFEFVVEE